MSFRSFSPVHRLSLARFVSMTGGEAAYLALVALLYERTGSALWVSIALFVAIGVTGICAPFAGALGDRMDRRRLLIASDVVAAVLFFAIAIVDQPWAIVGLAGLAAAAESPFIPTSTAAVPNLVDDPADLPKANALVAAGRNAGMLCGPLLGGLLVATLGAEAAFIGNGVTFLVSGVLIASIRRPLQGVRNEGESSGGVLEGFRILAKDRVLGTITIGWAVVLLGIGPLLVAEYPLAELFGMGSIGYGLLIAGWGGGTLIGAWLAPRAMRRRAELACVATGAFVMAGAIGSAGMAPFFVGAVIALLIGGVADGIASVAEETLYQRRTADEVRGRVVAAAHAIQLIALTISFAFGGFLLDAVGPRPVYVIAGLIFAFGALPIWLVLRSERRAGRSQVVWAGPNATSRTSSSSIE